MRRIALAGVFFSVAAVGAWAQEGVVSVERGFQIARDGHCHECHTVGYNKTSRIIDPDLSLKGKGDHKWTGPWGILYARNIRMLLAGMTEDEFVEYAKVVAGRGPMTLYATKMRAWSESDDRSLYQYVKSLGDPGEQVPDDVPPLPQ